MSHKATTYRPSRIFNLIQMVADLIKKDPRLADDLVRLRTQVRYALPPDMLDRRFCPNCTASMTEYVYIFDAWNALLLLRMAEAVRMRYRKGMNFTQANQVRIPDLEASHAVRCRTTQASKLGLVAQLKNPRTGGRVPGVWVITSRGWDALAGKSVPKKVKVWRGSIEERFDEKTTIRDALSSHISYVEDTIRRGRKPRYDHREEARSYDPSAWYEFSVNQGALPI